MSSQLQKERTYKWSVWRRFSNFEALDVELRKLLGWQMETIVFPPKHTFTIDKFSPPFMDARRRELNEYWQKVR